MSIDRGSHTIWMIISSYQPLVGGAERQAQALSEHLIGLGWGVRVVTRRHHRYYRYTGIKTEVMDGVPVHRVFSWGHGLLGAFFYTVTGLWFILRHGHRKDSFYAHDIGAPAWIAVVASWLLAGTCIVKIRSEKAAYYRNRWRVLQFRWLARIVDYFVAISQEAYDVLADHGVSDDRVFLLPNGVNSHRFLPASDNEKLASRCALGLPSDKIIVLCVGRLIPRKAHELLVLACANLPSEIINQLCVVIVGDGPEKERLLNLVQIKQLQQHFRFVGHQENPIPFYSAADFFVLQSWGEGLSNSLLESMSCGLPVICSHVGGAGNWVQPNVNGLLIPPRSVDDLRTALINILARKWEWPKMGTASRQIVEQKLALNVISQNFSKWLENIISR